jgi:hypothetical protein
LYTAFEWENAWKVFTDRGTYGAVEVHPRRQLAAAFFYGLSTRHICAIEVVYVYYLYIYLVKKSIDTEEGLGLALDLLPS